MAEETAEKKAKPEFLSVAADNALEVPATATADLVWHGTDGGEIAYRATAAHVDVRDDAGTLIGKMFSLAYAALDADGAVDSARPVTFAYNGGPGSASVPINFGGIGPKRVATDGLNHLHADAPLEDNPETLLRDSDLVFLDALGTGWSRFAEGADTKAVFGIDGDADAFARAICTWLEENRRWSSPVYLFGESYGTVRNAVLMRVLGERGVKVTGVVMLSALFDWMQVQPGSDTYYLGMMPTFAATAQHFGKAGQGVDVDEWFDRAMAWNEDVLAPALLRGDRLGAERERAVAEEMSSFIGLSVDHILEHHLRIDLGDFRTELLRAERRVCGRFDMRFTSDSPSPVQGDFFAMGEDASDDALDANWIMALRRFCSEELGYRGPATYLGGNYEKVNKTWKWSHEEPGTGWPADAPNVAVDLATALRRNPTCKLAIIGGRYDAATTFWNVVHDISCQFLSPALKQRIRWYRYGCGHMAYVDEPTLHAMGADLRGFYAMR